MTPEAEKLDRQVQEMMRLKEENDKGIPWKKWGPYLKR